MTHFLDNKPLKSIQNCNKIRSRSNKLCVLFEFHSKEVIGVDWSIKKVNIDSCEIGKIYFFRSWSKNSPSFYMYSVHDHFIVNTEGCYTTIYGKIECKSNRNLPQCVCLGNCNQYTCLLIREQSMTWPQIMVENHHHAIDPCLLCCCVNNKQISFNLIIYVFGKQNNILNDLLIRWLKSLLSYCLFSFSPHTHTVFWEETRTLHMNWKKKKVIPHPKSLQLYTWFVLRKLSIQSSGIRFWIEYSCMI